MSEPTPFPSYRSEAFAEDLIEPAPTRLNRRIEAVLGLLPLCTALLGFAFALI